MDLEQCHLLYYHNGAGGQSPIPSRRICLETSFTSLQSPIEVYHPNSSCQSSQTADSAVFPSRTSSNGFLLTAPQNCQMGYVSGGLLQPDRVTKVDLIHDDWFGLAPLATSESLSEISSISSRTSFGFAETKRKLEEEEEMRTPTVMRRTPKIPVNLSTCADDIKNVKYFQNYAKNIFCSGSDNSGGSFESAESKLPLKGESSTDSFASAENMLDGEECKSQLLETHFDQNFYNRLFSPRLLSPTSPVIDQDVISNFAIDLNLQPQNRSMQIPQPNMTKSSPSIDSGSICKTPTTSDPPSKSVSFNPQLLNPNFMMMDHNDRSLRPIIKESSPIHQAQSWKNGKIKFNRWFANQSIPKESIGNHNKRQSSSDEQYFSRKESSPLFSGLNVEKSSSHSYVRRKKYVYPMSPDDGGGSESTI